MDTMLEDVLWYILLILIIWPRLLGPCVAHCVRLSVCVSVRLSIRLKMFKLYEIFNNAGAKHCEHLEVIKSTVTVMRLHKVESQNCSTAADLIFFYLINNSQSSSWSIA